MTKVQLPLPTVFHGNKGQVVDLLRFQDTCLSISNASRKLKTKVQSKYADIYEYNYSSRFSTRYGVEFLSWIQGRSW